MTNPTPGYRSSEFWLSTLAMLLGVVLASGALPDGGMVAQIVGGALAVLARLGYDAGRAHVKAAASKAQAITSLAMRGPEQPAHPQSAPGSTSSRHGGAVGEPISDYTSTLAVGVAPHR